MKAMRDYQLLQELDALPTESRLFIEEYLADPVVKKRTNKVAAARHVKKLVSQNVSQTAAVAAASQAYNISKTTARMAYKLYYPQKRLLTFLERVDELCRMD